MYMSMPTAPLGILSGIPRRNTIHEKAASCERGNGPLSRPLTRDPSLGHSDLATDQLQCRPAMYMSIPCKPRSTLWTLPSAIRWGMVEEAEGVVYDPFNVALDEARLEPVLLLVTEEARAALCAPDAHCLEGVKVGARSREHACRREGRESYWS